MLTYRATLKPKSATRTPWQADTMFGHLCWLILYGQGEAVLNEFLASYQANDPPLLFSNGFPGDWLPRPLLPARPIDAGRPKQRQVDLMQQAKATKGIRWVSLAEFNRLRRGEPVELEPRPGVSGNRTILKNQINRLTFGTTPIDDEPGGGNLFNADELAFVDDSGPRPVGLDITIYLKVKDEAWAGRAETWLNQLALSGYGAKKSVGYGHFELARWERFTAFDDAPQNANGFIGLSNWVPAANDPTDGYYQRLVKYGKLGEALANADNPFKFPLIMLRAGSSFYTGEAIKEWYGRLVTGIAPANKDVVQYGYAFAVPARLDGSE
jgi:CRISPR-associated protein Csm4